jgi:myo-inositol-1(or 4)-monophosphatase
MDDLAQILDPVLTRCAQLAKLSLKSGEISISKDANEPSTQLDKNVDDLLRHELEQAYPGIPIVSEESSAHLLESSLGDFIVVDPIDGTKSLIAGSPLFGISIARVIDGCVVDAVIDFPLLNLRSSAVLGKGVTSVGILPSYLKSPAKIACSPNIRLPACVAANFHPVPTSALKLTLVALGQVNGAFYLQTRGRKAALWDYGAGLLLVREAGGLVTTLSGASLTEPIAKYTTNWVAAASPKMLEKAVRAASSPATAKTRRME